MLELKDMENMSEEDIYAAGEEYIRRLKKLRNA